MTGFIALGRWSNRPGHGILSPYTLRGFILVFSALAVIGGVFVGSAILSNSFSWAPYIPLGLIACGLGGWVVLAACYGSPTAIMLYFAVLSFVANGAFRDPTDNALFKADWQSMLRFLLWMGAGMIGFAHMPALRQLLARPACAWWLAYMVVAMTSCIYSPTPAYSFGYTVGLLCLFLFAFTLTTRISEGQLLWTLLLTLTVFNIGGWIAFFAFPDIGVSQGDAETKLLLGARMCGLAGQATLLGVVCAIAVGAAFVLWYTRRAGPVVSLILGGFAFVTLLQSNTRTLEISTVVGIGLILASRSAWRMALGALTVSITLLLLPMLPHVLNLLGRLFSRSSDDPSELTSLTGRTQIWDYSWRLIEQSPFLGYGYNSGKTVLASHIGFGWGDFVVDGAHNLWLQNLLSDGLVGTLPLVIVLGYLAYRMIKRPIPIVCYMIVTVFISGMTDADSIGGTPTLMTIMFFVASVWPGIEGMPVTDRQPARGIAAVRGRYRTLSL
jgi:exopolysaccharide production protein ExoQ